MSGANIVQGINAANTAPKPATWPQPPAPLIAPTGSPGLNAVLDVVNSTAAPFQSLPDPEQGVAGVVSHVVGGVLGVVGAPEAILDSAFAQLTAPIAALFPAMPAITIMGMHVGPPHGHLHPPSYTPPATPAPVPLPSFGMIMGACSIGVQINGMPAARAGDIGLAVACGGFCPPFEIHTGSSSVFIGGARAARMGDITRHCNPVAMGGLGLAMAVAGVVAGAAGAVVQSNMTMAAQAAADAAVLALKMMVGRDIAVPPAYGALVGPPSFNVSIGGFPCPPLMEALTGILKKIKQAIKNRPKSTKGDNAPCGTGAHPVNLVTGACFDEYVEYVSGGLFEWRRYYSSDRARHDGPMGHGSRHSYQHSLRVRLHRAVFTNWDGEEIEFPRFERGSNVTRAKGYVLTRVDPQTYRVSYLDQPELEFTGDRFAGDLRLARVWKENKELVVVRDAVGRITAFNETDHEQQTQRSFELRLSGEGRIVQLLEVGWAREPVVLRSYQYSDAGDLIASIDSSGNAHRFDYDYFHRLTKDLSPLGFAFTYKYDTAGRVVETTGQDGLWRAKLEYPEEGLTIFTEGEGARYEIHHDKTGAVTAVVDPYGGKLTRIIDGEGRVIEEIDPAGRKMRRLYDANGAHYARMDDYGHLLPPAVDAPIAPNPFARTLPATSLEWLLGDFAPPRTEKEGGGLWPISWHGPNPAALAGLPRDVAHLSSSIFAVREGPHAPARPPQVKLNARGDKEVEIDERGAQRRWYYDAAGNLVAEQDRDGRIRQFTIASWNLKGQETNELGQTISYDYSSLAEVVGVTDPLGNQTHYDHDLKKRLVRVHRHGRVRDEYVYDGDGHFVEKRGGTGQVLFRNEPHKNHLVAKRAFASGGYHQFDYDPAGRVTEASTQDHEVKLSYRGGSWPVTDMRDGKGVERGRGNSSEDTLLFERFLQRRERSDTRVVVHDPVGNQTTITFEDGLVRRFCANGTVETLQFDPEGRLLARLVHRAPMQTSPNVSAGARSTERGLSLTKMGLGSWATRYTYTLEGDLVRIDDSVRGTTEFEIDKAHRLCAEVTPRGERLEYMLDAANNVVSKPGLSGVRIQAGNLLGASQTERFEYDARDHLARREASDGTVVRYHYDEFDMLVAVEKQGAGGEHSLWEARYDALGRRILSKESGKVREFFWDYERLAAEIQPSGVLRIYQYASGTSLVPIGFTDYDSVDADAASGRSYYVFSDPVGMPLCIQDQDGEVVWWADRLDPYGAIQVAQGSRLEYNLRWPGHYFDPELNLHYNRWRYYDPNLGRYLQSDPIGYGGSPVNLYGYCPNPLVQVDLLGLAGAGGCESDHGDSHPKEQGENNGQEQTPGKPTGAQLASAANLRDPPQGYHWANVGGKPTLKSNPGSDNPPMMYNPNTGEFQPRPAADAYPRVSHSQEARDAVFEAGRGPDGVVRCPCGEEIQSSSPEHMDMGHIPGQDYASKRDQAIIDGTPRSEFRADQHDLSHYRPEHPSCNRSHQHE